MNRKRLLYVDDEPDIREVVQFALSLDPSLDVRVCASGAEALELAAQWLPQLVMLDVMMPTMDGPATLKALRSLPACADTPVVFITARTQAHEIERLLALGAAGVIRKPFDPMSLAATALSYMRSP